MAAAKNKKARTTAVATTTTGNTTTAKATVQRPRSKYTIQTSAMTPGVHPILERERMNVIAPTVYFTPQAYEQMRHIVDICPKEVGWFFLVQELDDGDFLLDSIYIPKQEVTATETDIDADAMTELALKLLDEGKDPSKLYAWFHSHVNMGVSPSGQDEHQVEDYLNVCPVFIRGIVNKKGDMKVDVYYPEYGVAFTCVKTRINYEGIDDTKKAELSALVKKNVSDAYVGTQFGQLGNGFSQRRANINSSYSGNIGLYGGANTAHQGAYEDNDDAALTAMADAEDDDDLYDPTLYGYTYDDLLDMTAAEFQFEFGMSKREWMKKHQLVEKG